MVKYSLPGSRMLIENASRYINHFISILIEQDGSVSWKNLTHSIWTLLPFSINDF